MNSCHLIHSTCGSSLWHPSSVTVSFIKIQNSFSPSALYHVLSTSDTDIHSPASFWTKIIIKSVNLHLFVYTASSQFHTILLLVPLHASLLYFSENLDRNLNWLVGTDWQQSLNSSVPARYLVLAVFWFRKFLK